MAILKTPDHEIALEGKVPDIGFKVVSWPWGGTPNLTQWSIDQLKLPLGTIIFDTVDGHPVIAQIQTHYSYGAHPDMAPKAHKGTSVFVPTKINEETGKREAVKSAPDGWGNPNLGINGDFGGDFGAIDFRSAALGAGVFAPLYPIGAGLLGFGLGGPIGAGVGVAVGFGFNWLKKQNKLPSFLGAHGDFDIVVIDPSGQHRYVGPIRGAKDEEEAADDAAMKYFWRQLRKTPRYARV